MSSEASTFRVPAAGLFRVGTITPKRSRNSNAKPSVKKRRGGFKKGIDASENRQRRSSFNRDLGRDKKNRVLTRFRSGTNQNATVDIKLNIKLGISETSYAGTAKEKLVAFYTDHNPSKLGDVDATLAKYAGKEEMLFVKLADRYDVNPTVFGVGASSIAPINTTHKKKPLVGDGKQKYIGSAKQKLIAFYNDRNPSKLGDVDKTVAKYAGKEEKLFLNLAIRYNVNPGVFGLGVSSAPLFANATTGAFKEYASGSSTFGSLAPTKVQSGGFGSFEQASGTNQRSKGRSTINSLKTYTDVFRSSSGSEGTMDCD